jgi:PAS domain S-box-containing protein
MTTTTPTPTDTSTDTELEQFRRLVLSVRDYAIFLLSPSGHISTWNPGAERLKGYTAAEAVGRHFSVFFTEEDRRRDHPAQELEVAAREGRFEEEGWRVRKDGSRFWAGVVLSAVRDDDGRLLGFAKVTRDLTERRAADHALRAANARLQRSNQELDRFAAVAAHDLREPLRTISGFGELLVERYGEALDERARGWLGQMEAAVTRMERLVDHLLAYARDHAPGAAGPVDVARGVAQVLGELQAIVRQRGARVEVELEPATVVLADPVDVDAVLRNLLSNAVKFADARAPVVTVRSTRNDDRWRVDIIDNGPGIEPPERARIFRAFHRAPAGEGAPGTGLGLTIAQRAVERHGGRIGVEPAVGGGSRFWFWLPAA